MGNETFIAVIVCFLISHNYRAHDKIGLAMIFDGLVMLLAIAYFIEKIYG